MKIIFMYEWFFSYLVSGNENDKEHGKSQAAWIVLELAFRCLSVPALNATTEFIKKEKGLSWQKVVIWNFKKLRFKRIKIVRTQIENPDNS